MSEMDRGTEFSAEELIATIEKRDSEDGAARTREPPVVGNRPSSIAPADATVFNMGATFRLERRTLQPTENVEDLARNAMLAAAGAIIQPWLNQNFPRLIEQRLSALLKEHVEQVAAVLRQ